MYQTFEHVSGYKSAIKSHIKLNRVRFSDDSLAMQTMFFGGYKRLIATKEQDRVRKIQEGKAPMSFSVYRFLSSFALAYRRDFYTAMFAHTFLLLCWNLIARCVSVLSLMYNHICWEGGAMVIIFPTTKSHKEEKMLSQDSIVKCPEISPILSFAVFVYATRSKAYSILGK